jgi:3'-phosphoadenosine 5'-phosphosulfate sulfotransferase
LIFLEHRKFKTQNELLNLQITNLKSLSKEYEKADSIQKKQLITFSQVIQTKNVEIEDLYESINKQKKKNKVKNYILGGVVAITILTVLISTIK